MSDINPMRRPAYSKMRNRRLNLTQSMHINQPRASSVLDNFSELRKSSIMMNTEGSQMNIRSTSNGTRCNTQTERTNLITEIRHMLRDENSIKIKKVEKHSENRRVVKL